MSAFDAIGMDAVGMSGQSAQSVTLIVASSSQPALSSSALVTITPAVNVVNLIIQPSLQSAISSVVSVSIDPRSVTLTIAPCIQVNTSSVVAVTRSGNTVALVVAPCTQGAASGYAVTTTSSGPIQMPTFTRSASRTIQVLANSRSFSGGAYWNMTNPKKPRGIKDPQSTIDISFDWTQWLDDIGNPDISSVTFTISNLLNAGTYAADGVATVFVSGGTGTEAVITCRIVANSVPVRVDERTIYLDLEDQ